VLLACLLGFRGRTNYTSLARHSGLSEKAYRRWFGKRLDFIESDRIGNAETIPAETEKVAALDASFVSKGGGKTLCLDSELSKAQNPRLIIGRIAGKSYPP
jgi:hypothetical protein